MALRVWGQISLWLGLGIFLFIYAPAIAALISPAPPAGPQRPNAQFDLQPLVLVIRALGAPCIGVAINAWVQHRLGDVTSEWIREVFKATLIDRDILSAFDLSTRQQIVDNALHIVAPLCAEPLSAFIAHAPLQERYQTKRKPRHEWELSSYPASGRGNAVQIDSERYFRVRIDETFNCDASYLQGDLMASFFLESDAGSEEALHKAFLPTQSPTHVIFRDILFLRQEEASKLEQLAKQQAGSTALDEVRQIVDIELSITSIGSSPILEHIPWLPDKVAYDGGVHFTWHRNAMPPALSRLDQESEVRLRLIHRFPVRKDAGFYPIVFGGFSCNPEVIVRFNTAEKLSLRHVFRYLVAPDATVFQLVPSFDGSEFRLHSDEHLHGRSAWLFPGSGLAIRWRLDEGSPHDGGV
jgi:hypothetical protein